MKYNYPQLLFCYEITRIGNKKKQNKNKNIYMKNTRQKKSQVEKKNPQSKKFVQEGRVVSGYNKNIIVKNPRKKIYINPIGLIPSLLQQTPNIIIFFHHIYRTTNFLGRPNKIQIIKL